MKLNRAVQELRRIANVVEGEADRPWADEVLGDLRSLARRLEAEPPACAHCEAPEFHEELR